MINQKLAIIIGHTDNNSGASMIAPYDYIQEYEYNTVLAGIISAIAGDRKIKCKVILRDGIGIAGAYAEALEYEADAIIELHFNAFSEGSVKGTETLYGNISGSYELASAVHEQICEIMERTVGKGDRGTRLKERKDRGGRNVNNGTEIPSILIEPFFGSNRTDCINGLINMKEIAEAILVGFLDFIYNDTSGNYH
jgi:N-acetylmuramoyl-L-alanine amidase